MSNGKFEPGTLFRPEEVFYVCLYEETQNGQQFMGKLVVEHGHPDTGKSYKPSNATAAAILYLLFSGEESEHISYQQLLDNIGKKFNNVIKSEIDDFLNDLIQKKAITTTIAGDTTPDPDPSGICGPPKFPFETPSLVSAKGSKVRSKKAFGTGQYFYTIRRW